MLLREYLPGLFLLMNVKLTFDLQEKQGNLGASCHTQSKEPFSSSTAACSMSMLPVSSILEATRLAASS